MTENTVNIPLLRKAVEWAEAEAAKGEMSAWDQTTFVETRALCGTAYCIAGYIGQMLDPAFVASAWSGEDLVSDVAAEALGIAPSTGITPGHLFYSGNTIEDVRRIAEDLAGERL